MSDAKALNDRIDVLETRLTFQDETIDTSTSSPHRKPQHQHDDGDDDDGPYDRRNLLRTAASRRVVGGVVEFAIHCRVLAASLPASRASALDRAASLQIYRNTARTLF